MRKLSNIFFVIVAVIAFYALGILTGYTVGYNDKYAEVVVKYRLAKVR